MASIDDLFKRPSLPGNKRKLESGHSSREPYKHAKLQANNSAHSTRRIEAQDPEDDDEAVAGPEPRPDEEEAEPEDDEEGRFFGGGITTNTANILDFVNGQDPEGVAPEKIDAAWLRKLALSFEKRISKNAELRGKFEDEPQKFMGSEADLDTEIKTLSSLSEHPELYEEFARLGCVGSLVSLLSHENTDIAIDAIEIISELTDEDVEAEQAQWDVLVDALIEADLLNLITENLTRFKEDNDSDRSGVYHALSVLENLASQVRISEKIGLDTTVMAWLLDRQKVRETVITQNKQYAAEVLAILLQSSSSNRKRLVWLDGVDVLLQLLSVYRKRDPQKGTDEEEYVENVFDALTVLMEEAEGKAKFVEAEGVELCLIMLREGMMSRSRALRLLDHSLGGPSGGAVSERLVEAAGLKTVFSMFVKKQDSQTVEHLVGIMSALLRLLPADSAPRIRTMAKFVEKDYEKIARLIKLRREYTARVQAADEEIKRDQSGLDADEVAVRADECFSRRLDAGLFTLQSIDLILAWLVAEDDGAKGRIQALLADRDETLDLIKASLTDQLSLINVAEQEEDQTREMLSALLQFL